MKESFRKSHGLPKVFRTQFIRRIDSLNKYIQCNNQDTEQCLQSQYKSYRNNLTTLMKQSKMQHYSNSKIILKNKKQMDMEGNKINNFLKKQGNLNLQKQLVIVKVNFLLIQ